MRRPAQKGESAAAGDGPLVMSMFITLGKAQQSMAPGENRYTDYLQEKFNVSFDLTVVPGEARLEKQNLLLASGPYPDIFFDGQFSPADQMKYGGQGVLMPLNDLIANYGLRRRQTQLVNWDHFSFHVASPASPDRTAIKKINSISNLVAGRAPDSWTLATADATSRSCSARWWCFGGSVRR